MSCAAPLVSVVIPAYDAGRFLASTLDSVTAQSFENWECIVVDDSSADDTLAIARQYEAQEERIRVIAASHGGSSHARNIGFRAIAASSRYVSFMDADDVWLPHALADLLEHLERHPQLVGSHGLGEIVNEEGTILEPGAYATAGRARLGLERGRLVAWPLDRPTTFNVLINGNVLFPPGLLLARRSAYDRAGPFDESLAGPEDWDMLIRLSRIGDLGFVNDVILLYRRHDSNQGANPNTPRQAWLVRCIAFHSSENTPEQRLAARRGWRAYQLMLASMRLRDARSALARGRILTALDHLARLPVFAWRYIRGYPRPRVQRPPLTW